MAVKIIIFDGLITDEIFMLCELMYRLNLCFDTNITSIRSIV